MTCDCGKESTVEVKYAGREYCDNCFLEYIEKRVRKNIRIEKDIQPLDTIYLYDDDSKEHFAAKYFLNNVFGDNLTVKTTKELKEPENGKLVIPTNMDRTVSEKLQKFLENEIKTYEHIILLDNVLEEELVEICRILGREAEETEEVNMLIENMEEKYPDAKFSLYRGFQKLEEELSS